MHSLGKQSEPELDSKKKNNNNISLTEKRLFCWQVVDSHSENKDAATEAETGLDIDESLQDELCELWDMSMNSVRNSHPPNLIPSLIFKRRIKKKKRLT